jgi:hypothetical protein
MDKDRRDRIIIVIVATLAGGFAVLEGTGVTQFGEMANNTPRWVLTMVGVMFLTAALMVFVGTAGWPNELGATVILGGMALMFGWVSFYGDEAGFSGSGVLISQATGLPVGRIMFGLGASMCLAGAIYALTLCIKKLLR